MHVLEELDKKLFDALDKLNQVKLKTQKENVTLADAQAVDQELNLINKELKCIEEERKQNNLVEQNQTKLVTKVLFYITGFLSFCSILPLLFPKFYPKFFLAISNTNLPSFITGQYQSLVFAFICCFFISAKVDNLEKASLISLRSLKYKAFLIIALLISIVLLAPGSWIVILWPLLAEKYYKRKLNKAAQYAQ